MKHGGAPTRFKPWHLPVSGLEVPAAGAVHAWYLDFELLGGPLAQDQPLSGRAASLAERTLRRFYLRLLLGAYLGRPGKDVEVLRTGRGKPYVGNVENREDLRFSMARSQGRCLIAIASGAELGVDLEPAERVPGNALKVARRYFSAAEADALAQLEGEPLRAAFMRTWALKEAVVKASGQGIANHLARFTVDTRLDRAPTLLSADAEVGGPWSLNIVEPEPDYIGALAVGCEVVEVTGFRLLPPATAAM